MPTEQEVVELHKFLKQKEKFVLAAEKLGLTTEEDLEEFINKQKASSEEEPEDQDDEREDEESDEESSSNVKYMLKEVLKPLVEEIESMKEGQADLKKQWETYEGHLQQNSKDLSDSKIEKLLEDPNRDLTTIKNLLASGDKNFQNNLSNMVKNNMNEAEKNKKPISFEDAVQKVNDQFKSLAQKATGTYNPEGEAKPAVKAKEEKIEAEEDTPQMTGDEGKLHYLKVKDPAEKFKGKSLTDPEVEEEIAREAFRASGSDPDDVNYYE